MLQYERFESILNKLESRSSVRVTDLSKELGVSESTIRRDITDLDQQGRLKKVFGGAVPIASASTAFAGSIAAGAAEEGSPKRRNEERRNEERNNKERINEEKQNGETRNGETRNEEMRSGDGPAFAPRVVNAEVNAKSRDLREKEALRADEKTEVAAKAATLIEDGDLVYIDAGTTTGRMIDHITCREATFVTNGARHAIELARRGLRTYLISGRMKARTEAIIGYDAVENLRKYHFSKCFIGTDGIDENYGMTTADIDESMVKTEAISRSRDVYILADSSKFGLVASVTFAKPDAGTVITDRVPDPAYRTQMKVMELHGEEER